MNAKLDLNGLDKLLEDLDKEVKKQKLVKGIVKYHTAELQKKAKDTVPVRTSNLKRSIKLRLEDQGYTGRVKATADYAPYVEYGTRFMNPNPFMLRALHVIEPQFLGDIKEVVKLDEKR